jgi:hypothetical protein
MPTDTSCFSSGAHASEAISPECPRHTATTSMACRSQIRTHRSSHPTARKRPPALSPIHWNFIRRPQSSAITCSSTHHAAPSVTAHHGGRQPQSARAQPTRHPALLLLMTYRSYTTAYAHAAAPCGAMPHAPPRPTSALALSLTHTHGPRTHAPEAGHRSPTT